MSYQEFLASKSASRPPAGLDCLGDFPASAKQFQRDVMAWSLRQGRGAIFAGTGLGKTLMQLTWAREVAGEGLPALILAPLAVAQQTVGEAVKFGIDSVAYARDQSEARTDIVVTNYDRFEKFDMSGYGGIVLDESSILKSHDSKTRLKLTEACRVVPYRLCCTATPAPNDYVELGNHAEFLGVTTQKEMLATWFVHEGGAKATGADTYGIARPEWRLKGHAAKDFWRWLASWSVMIRHPRDLGYDDTGYDLPALNQYQITVPAEYGAGGSMLFPAQASTLQERLAARRESIAPRARAAEELVHDRPDRQWLIWCNLNDEADAIRKLIPHAVEVRGTDDPDFKADRLLKFASAQFRCLISKPSICGFGMNFQSCADMIFVGLNDSFEQLYQAIRRCWRFGQTKPVNVYLIASEREGAVVANLAAKEAAAERMAEAMSEHMRDLSARALRGTDAPEFLPHTQPMSIPSWL